MKKVFLAAAVAMMSFAASAQVWVGGNVGFAVEEPEGGEKITSYTIAPEVGYTLNEKWDIAAAFNYSHAKQDADKTTSWSIEPYARYTFAESGIVKFFVEGGFGYGNVEEESAGYKADGSKLYVGVRPGIKVDVNDNLAVVTKLGFLGYEDVEDQYSAFGFNVGGNDLSLGIVWKF